jgi:hypothetical protein
LCTIPGRENCVSDALTRQTVPIGGLKVPLHVRPDIPPRLNPQPNDINLIKDIADGNFNKQPDFRLVAKKVAAAAGYLSESDIPSPVSRQNKPVADVTVGMKQRLD